MTQVTEASEHCSIQGGMASKLQWSDSMDLVLIRTLVDESNTGGKKADNGWNSSALERVVEEIKKSHNMVITHDHVRSRLKTFKKQYLAVREVHKQSGFGFDYSSGLITADNEVWEDYVAAHKEAKKVRGKIFPYNGDLAIIIGNDQATGDRCIASRDDDNVPMVEVSESVHTDTGDREDVASGSTTSSRKRKRTCDNNDPEFAKAISSICKAFEQASAMRIRLETFPWQEVEKAVRAVPGLTERQILKIMRKFNGNVELGTFFLGLTEKTREGWVLAELEDN